MSPPLTASQEPEVQNVCWGILCVSHAHSSGLNVPIFRQWVTECLCLAKKSRLWSSLKPLWPNLRLTARLAHVPTGSVTAVPPWPLVNSRLSFPRGWRCRILLDTGHPDFRSSTREAEVKADLGRDMATLVLLSLSFLVCEIDIISYVKETAEASDTDSWQLTVARTPGAEGSI